jgi:hypothetical protein
MNLTDIKQNTGKKQYKFKDIQFLTSTQTKDKLVVMFHGGRCGSCLPIFRGYDYTFKDSNILSFSDPLYKFYDNINVGWYFNTTKYSTLREDIRSIVEYIADITKAIDIIFVAQCSGSMIAIELGCLLNQYVLITNPHLILKSDDCYIYHHYDKNGKKPSNGKITLDKALERDNQQMVSMDDLDIRNVFKTGKFPKKIQIFAHKDDYTTNWILKVKECLDILKKSDIYDINLHTDKCVSPHHCPLPNNGKLINYIKKFKQKYLGNL